MFYLLTFQAVIKKPQAVDFAAVFNQGLMLDPSQSSLPCDMDEGAGLEEVDQTFVPPTEESQQRETTDIEVTPEGQITNISKEDKKTECAPYCNVLCDKTYMNQIED